MKSLMKRALTYNNHKTHFIVNTLRFFTTSVQQTPKCRFILNSETQIQNPKPHFLQPLDSKFQIPFTVYKAHKTLDGIKKELRKGIFLKVTREKQLRYSAYKLNEAMKRIRNRYLDDAIREMEQLHTKGGREILKRLNSFKAHWKNDDFQLRIKTAIVGKRISHKLPMYRAKGRVNFIQRPKSSYTIQMEKVPKEEVCRQIAIGKTPSFLAHTIRASLYKGRADLEELRQMAFAINASGRYQRRKDIRQLTELIRRKMHRDRKILLSREVVKQSLEKDLGKAILPFYEKYISEASSEVEEKEEDQEEKKRRHLVFSKNFKLDH